MPKTEERGFCRCNADFADIEPYSIYRIGLLFWEERRRTKMTEKERLYRVVTFLNREELDYLDELNKDIFFQKGINIPRTKLIEEIIEAFKEHRKNHKQEAEEELAKRYKEEAQ